MNHFKRYYKASTAILGVMLIFSTLRSLLAGEFLIGIVVLLIAAVPRIPILRSGGLDQNRRLAIGISVSLAAGFATIQIFFFVEFVRTEGLEGPNGEGAPGAVIIAMLLFAVLILCPWLLTALRGLRFSNLQLQEAESSPAK